MRYVSKIFMVLGVVLVAGLFINSVNQNADKQEFNKNFEVNNTPETIKVPDFGVPENLFFAGEPVPVNDPDIYERMDREMLVNAYWESSTWLILKRANKYFPIIEPILKNNGVPDDFKYLAVIESGLTNAVSPAKATGFWQILPETGKQYGLEVNAVVDERYHLEKSTEAACKYLKDAKAKFGSWTLAAASYNAGMAGIGKQLERQKEANYYNVLLNEETGRYIFRILALKEIMQNPAKYGYNIEQSKLYKPIPVSTVMVDTAVSDFADFSKKLGINYKILKLHNPWLREAYLTNPTGKKYYLKIPEKGSYPSVD